MFITKGKTNWPLVVVVAFFAGIAGSGIMLYISDTIWQTNCLMRMFN